MDSKKFLGICILISSIIVSVAILYHAGATKTEIGRYQFHPSNPPGVIWKMDTITGNITTGNG